MYTKFISSITYAIFNLFLLSGHGTCFTFILNKMRSRAQDRNQTFLANGVNTEIC